MKHAEFLIFKRNENDCYFELQSRLGVTIFTGESFPDRQSCINAIGVVKINSLSGDNFQKIDNPAFRFILRDDVGKLIGSGTRYSTAAGRDTGMSQVRADAVIASIKLMPY